MSMRSYLKGTRTLQSYIKYTVACLAVLGGFTDAMLHAQHVNLLEGSAGSIVEHNCELHHTDSELTITTGEKDAIIDFADFQSSDLNGPVELHFRMKTQVNGELDEYIVYWVTGEQNEWKQFQRIPFRPDGQWHNYRLPLAATSDLKAIRFTFGRQPHEVSLADVRLTRTSTSLPSELGSQQAKLPESITISHENLTLQLDCLNHTYAIQDANTGRAWQSESVSKWLTLCKVEKIDSLNLQVSMYDWFAQQPVIADIELATEGVVKFSIASATTDAPINAARCFPPRFSTDMPTGKIVFCDRSCGVLLDQQDDTYANWPLRVYGNLHCLDMPWVGLYDDERGDGMMLLVETPADAEVAFVADPQGRHWPEVRWLASLDTFRYRRSVSMRFTSAGKHVELAQKYRAYLKQEGRFKTLAEKAKAKPAVEQLRGAPSIWGGRYPTKFIRQMRPLGVTRGIVNTCKDPGIIRWLNEQGYLTGRYDSYTDIVEGTKNFQRDDVELVAVRSRPGGPPKHGWKKRGGTQMYWRSSAAWSEAAASYVEQELSRLPYTERFIDVAAAAALIEDYHPQHTFDRRQDLANRRALFEQMNKYNLVLGTEHGNDWVVDQVEYFEGAMSGPFWWASWPAGYLDRPKREQLTPEYLKYGMGYAHRVPLWELVYHDSALSTWYWGDTAGLLYEAAPELSDRKDLFNILYGTTPLFWMNGTGYKLPEQQHRMLQSFHDTCPLHEVVAFEQMTSHEFLSEDSAVQRTRFSNGTVVAVNFSDEPRAYNAGKCDVVLAPRGFHIHGDRISQTRLWVDDHSQTVISKPGYLTVESNGKQLVAGVKCNGRVTMLKDSENRWNLFLDPDRDCELNIAAITDWKLNENLRICYMDDIGELHKAACHADEQGLVKFKSAENAWRFALVRDPPQDKLAAHPADNSNSEKSNQN